MRWSLVGLLAAGTLVLSQAAPAARSDGSAVDYTDAAHEAGSAPDLRDVEISTLGAQLRFSFHVDGFPRARLALGVFDQVFACLDTDRNWSTGSKGGGCDYGFWLTRSSAPGESLFFAKWDRGAWASKQNPADVAVSDGQDGFTVTFPASKVGGATRFDFYAESEVIKDDGLGRGPLATDYLPDHGSFDYPTPQPDPQKPQDGAATFADPAGDSHGGVDLFNVSVADGPNSAVRFAFSVKGVRSSGVVRLVVDADEDPSTGIGGADYVIDFLPLAGWSWELFREAGGARQFVTAGDSAVSGPGTTVTATFGRHDLGGTRGFDFYVVALNFDANGHASGRDDGPDTGSWRYTPVALTGDQLVRPVIGKAVARPAVPVVGKRWTLTFPITRGDNGRPFVVTGVDGGPDLSYPPARPRFGPGFVRWSFVVPKRTRGHVMHVDIAVYDATQAAYASRHFTVH